LIADSLKKGNCIDFKPGSPVVILGTDLKSSLSKNNYLIWHSNVKVYSASDKKIANVLSILALPEVVARQGDPVYLKPATLPTENPSNVEEGGFLELVGYLVAAALIAVASFVLWTNRYCLRWLRSRKRRAGALNPRSSLHLTLSRPREDAYTAQVERVLAVIILALLYGAHPGRVTGYRPRPTRRFSILNRCSAREGSKAGCGGKPCQPRTKVMNAGPWVKAGTRGGADRDSGQQGR